MRKVRGNKENNFLTPANQKVRRVKVHGFYVFPWREIFLARSIRDLGVILTGTEVALSK
jgi:hypothetical protein